MDHRERIQQSLETIEDNLKAEITAAELAEQAGYSLFHYYRLFQSVTGLPVMQYIVRRRLLHGVYEIAQGRRRIAVYAEYGFDTYAGFYKAFQREFGCSPSAFIKKGRAKQPHRPDLFKEEHMTVSHKRASEILKFWGLENEPITDIYYEGTGEHNESAFYVGESFVLKLSADLTRVKNHITLSKAIEGVGLQAATPVLTQDGREYVQEGDLYFYVTRRITGSQMIPAECYTGDLAATGKFIGEIIGKLHLALQTVEAEVNENDLCQTVLDWALPAAGKILNLPAGFLGDCMGRFTALYDFLPRQIIHRDPNPSNIILAEEKWGVIDFDLSEKTARIYDPCYAATAILCESFDEQNSEKLEKWLVLYQNILRGYDGVVSLTPQEREAAPYMVLANQLICVAWLADQEKYRAIFEVNLRMTRWLIDNFEKLRLS